MEKNLFFIGLFIILLPIVGCLVAAVVSAIMCDWTDCISAIIVAVIVGVFDYIIIKHT